MMTKYPFMALVILLIPCLSAQSNDFEFESFKDPVDTYSEDNEAELVLVGHEGIGAQGPDITSEDDIIIDDGLAWTTFSAECELGFEMKAEDIQYTPDIKRMVQTWVYAEWWDGGSEVVSNHFKFELSGMFWYQFGNPPYGFVGDDAFDYDEDLTPSNQKMIYSMDAPGATVYVPAGYETGDTVYFCYRFLEWVEPDGGDCLPNTADDESTVKEWSYVFKAEVDYHPPTQDLYLKPAGHSHSGSHVGYPDPE